jgi:hypothetical protein
MGVEARILNDMVEGSPRRKVKAWDRMIHRRKRTANARGGPLARSVG